MSMNGAIIELLGVWKSFGPLEVLKGLSFEVDKGTVTTLIGPSGCGKSTCLRCINTLEDVNKGSIRFKGQIIDYRDQKVKRNIRQRVGMVFQSYNLFPHMTVEENVTIAPRKVLGEKRAEARKRAQELLEQFGLGDKAKAMPDELSGGQQQRVALIRAMAMDPEVLLLDEITAALDPELTTEVLGAIRQLAEEGMTMVVVSHEIHFVKRLADQILFLEGGKVLESGPPDEVLGNPSERLRAFLSTIAEQ